MGNKYNITIFDRELAWKRNRVDFLQLFSKNEMIILVNFQKNRKNFTRIRSKTEKVMSFFLSDLNEDS